MKSATTLPTPPESTRGDTPSAVQEELPEIQWWNVNVPERQWTDQCPEYLVGQKEKNIGILSTKDEDHPRMLWTEVQELIDTDSINHFHRMPSDLRRYLKYCHDLKGRFGSILNFMQHERLEWSSMQASGDALFSNAADYKILYNDWPYSLDQHISHIVVWTKFVLEEDPRTGLLKEESKLIIEDFISKTFCHSDSEQGVVDRSQLRWFKNWKSLRSVHALEHFHVMLYDAPKDLLDRVTQGDVPMCERFETIQNL